MTYQRPPGSGRADFQAAREFEETVGEWLGEWKIANLDSPDRLDYWIPGLFLEVKEKRQQLGDRFAKHWPGVPAEELFVLDELSVRRAIQHGYRAYFLFRDKPRGRYFLARLDEVCAAERVRVDRETSPGKKKGKWLLDLRSFNELVDPEKELLGTLLSDQIATPWKRSECLSRLSIPTV